MTIDEIKEKLNSLIIDDKFFQTRESRAVTFERFLQMFGECELTYQSLIEKDGIQDSGWKDIFDEWKEKGLIN